MSLPVPLTVRIGDQHITRKVESLSFRKEAVGGLRSISFKLRHAVDAPPEYLEPLGRVDIFDARTAEIVAQGRVTDPGRSTGNGGQAWDIVAFGPMQAASDVTRPKVWIDRGIDGWVPHTTGADGSSQASVGSHPDTDTSGLLSKYPNGTRAWSGSRTEFVYKRIWYCEDQLAFIYVDWDAGESNADFALQIITGVDGSLTTTAGSELAATGGGFLAPSVGVQILSGENTAALRFAHPAAPVTVVATETLWGFWSNMLVETIRHEVDGTEILTGYSGAAYPSAIVEDMLGGDFLPAFDGPRSKITTSTGTLNHLAYPEGVTAEQVLADLMAIDPAYRWYTEPDRTGDGYVLRWEVWPTSVRYEATIEDGGSFPMSTQDVYNRVIVRWRDTEGQQRLTSRTMACDILDEAGVTRQAVIDMPESLGLDGSNVHSFGDNFLTEHNVPKNGGTLSIARPIRDLQTGRMVEPFEIEAGELVRVRGIESYPDALNADSNDGQTVFRIFAVDYASDDNRANLSLDADPKTTSAALAKLLRQRTGR